MRRGGRFTRCKRLGVGLLTVFVLSGCFSSQSLEGYQPRSQDEAHVVSMLQKIPNGIASRSVELLMQAYADDLYVGNFHKYLGVAAPTAPRSITKPELRTTYAQLFRSVKDIAMDVKNFQLTLSGDRAVVEARTELMYSLEAGRKEARQEYIRNDVIWRLRRTPTGWKIQEEIFQ